MDNRYIKFPTVMLEFIMRAKLTEQQNKMLCATIRHCHGFHQPFRLFGLPELGKWLGWDRRSLYRTAEELAQRAIFQKDGKYRIEPAVQKWQAEWRGRPVDNPVDKLLISPDQPNLFGTLLSSPRHAFVIPTAHISTEIGHSVRPTSCDPKSAIANDNPKVINSNVLDASEFLKISLKKYLKKEEDPDLEKRKIDQKNKDRIFREMVRSGQWNDDELLELAKNHTAEELEELFGQKRLSLKKLWADPPLRRRRTG